MKLIDGHCHLANLSALMPLEPLLEEASRRGIVKFLSSALTKAEVRYYLDHSRPEILFSAGIHPNYDECDLELEDIATLCAENRIWAVGEIGLDRNGPDLEIQMAVLARQLEIARQYKLPAVLHIVGHQPRAYEILRRFPLRYLVHGYAGSIEGFQLFSRLGCQFTISERILRPDKLELLQMIVRRGSYLFETDITRHYVEQNEPNPLLRLLGVLSRTAELCDVAREELLERQTASFVALTGDQP